DFALGRGRARLDAVVHHIHGQAVGRRGVHLVELGCRSDVPGTRTGLGDQAESHQPLQALPGGGFGQAAGGTDLRPGEHTVIDEQTESGPVVEGPQETGGPRDRWAACHARVLSPVQLPTASLPTYWWLTRVVDRWRRTHDAATPVTSTAASRAKVVRRRHRNHHSATIALNTPTGATARPRSSLTVQIAADCLLNASAPPLGNFLYHNSA